MATVKRIITAVFKGKDGSMGYKNGGHYSLVFQQEDNGLITISSISKKGKCVYSNAATFALNWNVKEVSNPEPISDLKKILIMGVAIAIGALACADAYIEEKEQ